MLSPFSATPDFPNTPNCSWQEYFDSFALEWARNRPRPASSPPQSTGIHKLKWTPEEDAILDSTVQDIGTLSWQNVAERVPGRSGKQCRERWLSHMAPDVSRDAWSPEEDAILLGKHNEFGRHWAKIRHSLPGRSTSAIKNRWNWLCRRDVQNHWTEFQQLCRVFVGDERKSVMGDDDERELQGMMMMDGDGFQSFVEVGKEMDHFESL
jgi:hypothetical protein